MLTFRFANRGDAELYFKWANDELVRQYSYKNDEIAFEDHLKWFEEKLQSDKVFLYLFLNESGEPVGQVRIEIKKDGKAIVGISTDKNFRKQGLGAKMLVISCENFHKHESKSILAYIMKTNTASYYSFLKAGFQLLSEELIEGVESYVMIKYKS